MIIPHLVLAHLLADYVLQTDWLAQSKTSFVFRDKSSWGGLLLHGSMVWFVSLMVLPNYIDTIWPYITLIAVAHTLQDGLKSWISQKSAVHPFFPYAFDQLGHLILLIIIQNVIGDLLVPPPDQAEITVMLLSVGLIAVTRFYEVTWWANWQEMYKFFRTWWKWLYAERAGMLLLSAVNLWILVPLLALPRLAMAQYRNEPLGKQERGTLELLLGMGFSVILGVAFF